MIRILGRESSINVRKVLWTCAELALPFEREDWGNGFRSPQEPAFLARNPNGLVPVLEDGAPDNPLVLWESNTICRYLAAREGATGLLPAAPAARAVVEQWMDWQAGELNNAWRYAFMALVRRSTAHTDATAVADSARAWNRHMTILERQLQKTGGHVAGAAFTLADIVLGLATQRWLATPIERPELSAVLAYHARLSARPAWAASGAAAHP